MILSIIIPVYNTEIFLKKCFDSIFSQIIKYENIVEVYIVNDGSTDNSQNIIDLYKLKYSTLITVIKKENGGLSEARNVALDKVSGKYVWFVDSDDSIEYDIFPRIIEILKSNDVDYIYFNAYNIDYYNNIIGSFSHDIKKSGTFSFEFNSDEIINTFKYHMVWMRFFKKDFIGDLRFPKGITHEDIHFDLQLLAKNPAILYIDDYFYRHYYDNPESITNNMSSEKFKQILWLYNDLYNKFSQNQSKKIIDEYKKVALVDLSRRIVHIMSKNVEINNKKNIFYEYANSLIYLYDKNNYFLLKNKINKRFFKALHIVCCGYVFIGYMYFNFLYEIKSCYSLMINNKYFKLVKNFLNNS